MTPFFCMAYAVNLRELLVVSLVLAEVSVEQQIQHSKQATARFSTAPQKTCTEYINGKLQQNHVVDFITNDHESL